MRQLRFVPLTALTVALTGCTLAGDSHRSVSLICTVTGIQPAPRFLVDLDAREDFRHRLTIGSNVLHAAKMWHTGVLRQRRIA